MFDGRSSRRASRKAVTSRGVTKSSRPEAGSANVRASLSMAVMRPARVHVTREPYVGKAMRKGTPPALPTDLATDLRPLARPRAGLFAIEQARLWMLHGVDLQDGLVHVLEHVAKACAVEPCRKRGDRKRHVARMRLSQGGKEGGVSRQAGRRTVVVGFDTCDVDTRVTPALDECLGAPYQFARDCIASNVPTVAIGFSGQRVRRSRSSARSAHSRPNPGAVR